MNTTSLAFATAFALTTALPSTASGCALLRDGPRGVVTEVIDGDTVMLDNGLTVRLIGIQAPKLAKGRTDFEDWPLAESARNALEELVVGQSLSLRYGGAERDRHQRVLAQGFVGADAVWVQKRLLELGLARVYSFPDNRACLDELYAAEQDARSARRGLWGHEFYAVRQANKPKAMQGFAGRYELVEGRVLQAQRAGRRVYLNFGRLWREDFTVVIDRSAQKLFDGAAVDPTTLDGALIRVRGWMDDKDGPRITVTHPEQIEVLAFQ